ncbi:MAG: hypothetical protein GC160_00110 [Acidobacteria bacterium]|nr:hypothetical protein [Acidobacteriota bacterium]
MDFLDDGRTQTAAQIAENTEPKAGGKTESSPPQYPGFRLQPGPLMISLSDGNTLDLGDVGGRLHQPLQVFKLLAGLDIPLWIYERDGDVLFDADLINQFSPSPIKTISLRGNKVTFTSVNIDSNFDDRALEVVNGDRDVLFRCVYLTERHVRVEGVFLGPEKKTLIVGDKLYVGIPYSKEMIPPPLFKYPSWRYPGIRSN